MKDIFVWGRPVHGFAVAYGRRCFFMTEEQKRKVSDLRRAGIGYTETERLAGVSRDAVRSFCRRNGLAGEAAKNRTAEGQEGF